MNELLEQQILQYSEKFGVTIHSQANIDPTKR